jgi:mRNA-degrading endonuclease HigB of HigAB toxin-antitoxin module
MRVGGGERKSEVLKTFGYFELHIFFVHVFNVGLNELKSISHLSYLVNSCIICFIISIENVLLNSGVK